MIKTVPVLCGVGGGDGDFVGGSGASWCPDFDSMWTATGICFLDDHCRRGMEVGDDETCIYDNSSCSPNEDIWKKFELPTPPRSPGRDSPLSIPEYLDDFLLDEDRFPLLAGGGEFLDRMDDSHLDSLLQELGNDEEDAEEDDPWTVDGRTVSHYKSELLHDCMWSGQCVEEHRRAPISRSASIDSSSAADPFVRTDSQCSAYSDYSNCSSSSSTSSSSSSASSSSATSLAVNNACIPVAVPLSPLSVQYTSVSLYSGFGTSPGDCIDPTNVFPYPLSDHSYHACKSAPTTPSRDALGIQTPSDSEEEIDVVTVGDKQQQQQKIRQQQQQKRRQQSPIRCHPKTGSGLGHPNARRRSLPSHPSPQVRRQLQLVMAMATKDSSSSRMEPGEPERRHHHHHRIHSAKRGDHPCKAKKTDGPLRLARRGTATATPPSGRWSARQSSDSEDSGKRREHNDLERKRRNDLRFSFQTLRRNVPDIRCNERAPKVLILRKAMEHVQHLTSTFAKLDRIHKAEVKRKAELERRLLALQRRR